MTLQELKTLALHAANRTAPDTFSVDSVDKAVHDELNRLSGTVNDFMRNRYDIYDIIIQTPERPTCVTNFFARLRPFLTLNSTFCPCGTF